MMGINRNIVECKVEQYSFEKRLPVGINRNIVECKGSKRYVSSDLHGRY